MFCKEFINKFFIKKGLQNQTGEPNKRISNDEVKAQVERYIGKYLFDYCISAEGMTH